MSAMKSPPVAKESFSAAAALCPAAPSRKRCPNRLVGGDPDVVALCVGEDAEGHPGHLLRTLDDRAAELLGFRKRRLDVLDADEEEGRLGASLQRPDRRRDRSLRAGRDEAVAGECAVG